MKLKTIASEGGLGQEHCEKAASYVAMRLLGVLRLEINTLQRRAELLQQTIETDRDDGHQPEQVEAMRINKLVTGQLLEYPNAWDWSAIATLGEKPAAADLVAVRELVIEKIRKAWNIE